MTAPPSGAPSASGRASGRDSGRRSGGGMTRRLLAAAMAGLLLVLLWQVLSEGRWVALDQALNQAFAPYRHGVALVAFVWLTDMGTGSTGVAVALVASVLFWAGGRTGFVGPLWVTFLGAEATTWAGKVLVGRVRPEFIEAASAASPSFPSAHATVSVAVYGFVAYAACRGLPGRRDRVAVAAGASVLIALVCFSRLYLSLHYLGDVLAGALVAGLWLLLGIHLAERGGGTARAAADRPRRV